MSGHTLGASGSFFCVGFLKTVQSLKLLLLVLFFFPAVCVSFDGWESDGGRLVSNGIRLWKSYDLLNPQCCRGIKPQSGFYFISQTND